MIFSHVEFRERQALYQKEHITSTKQLQSLDTINEGGMWAPTFVLSYANLHLIDHTPKCK